MSPKPTILLIHGAYHGPWCWEYIVPRLESAGYEVITPHNPSTQAPRSPPVTSHMEDVEHARSILKRLVLSESKDVLVVGHSYGGMVASGCVSGFEKGPSSNRPNGVIGVVFVAAFALPVGKHTLSPGSSVPRSHVSAHPEFEGYVILHGMEDFMYNATDPEQAAKFTSKLEYQAVDVFMSKAESMACTSVPCSYVHCTEDKACLFEWQEDMVRGMVREARWPVTTYWLETDHSPFVSKVVELAWILRRAAGEGWLEMRDV